MSGFLGEAELTALETSRDPAVIPRLVEIIRRQHHDLEQLRLAVDVARRDREELRGALIHAQERLRDARADR
jgi:hypothetical protein